MGREAPSPGEVESLKDADALDGGDSAEAPEPEERSAEPAPDEATPDGAAGGAPDTLPEEADRAPPEFEGLGNLELLPMAEEDDSAEAVSPDVGTDDPWGEDSLEEGAGATSGAEAASPPSESPFVTSAEEELLGGMGADAGAREVDGEGLELESSLEASYRDAGTGTGEDDAFGSVWESPEDHQPPEPPTPESVEDAEGGASEPGDEETEFAPVPLPPRSAPPQRKLTRARTPGAERIVGVAALVVVVGAALFFGWRFAAPALGVGGFGEPEIVLPPLEQELVPRMRQLAGRASGRMAQDMLTLPERAAIPGDPSEDWLAGIYLAGASGYPGIPAYWEAVAEWVAASRTAENALFREALQAQLDTANLAASDAEAIRDRALAGFQAAGSDRRIVYEQMQEVAERALVLHEFLVANEDQVTYEPAGSGVSRDPALEAVPATPALGDEMWEMVGSITNAMDALGYLDRIETERLLAVFLEKLEATAIR
jgi:hypothetical protein